MIEAIILTGGLAVFFGIVLGLAYKFFNKPTDAKVEEIYKALPHLDCGACGHAGCRQYAEAIAKGEAPDKCKPGGEKAAKEISRIIGKDVHVEKQTARVHCVGGKNAKDSYEYEGPSSCKDAAVIGSAKQCRQGCIGFGDCVEACNYDAIHLDESGVPVVDQDKCVACGACVSACPQDLIDLVPVKSRIWIGCSSTDPAGVKAKYCKTGCIACGICANTCPNGAITMVDNLPRIDYQKCTSCGACVEKCPRKVIKRL